MRRREFCTRSLAGLGALASPFGNAAATTDPGFGRISTRGHFDLNLGLQTGYRDGHGRYDYDVVGPIPGYTTDESPDEICVFVHGWLQGDLDVEDLFPKQKRALERAGFDGPVVAFEWGSVTPKVGYYVAAERARRNGHKLGTFLRDYRERNPSTRIRVIGFSLGAVVPPSAGRSLHRRDWQGTIDSVALIGSAVGDQALSLEGRYGPGCEAVYGEVDNYYKTDDTALTFYPFLEMNDAIGIDGIEGEPPENYEQHRVDYVESHGDYWKYGDGCVRRIVSEWEDGELASAGDPGSGPGGSSTTERFEGVLDAARDDATHSVVVQGTGPVTLQLSGPARADFDLYVTADGRVPAPDDFDHSARSRDATERLTVPADDLEAGTTLGILVRSYQGAGEYALTVESTAR